MVFTSVFLRVELLIHKYMYYQSDRDYFDWPLDCVFQGGRRCLVFVSPAGETCKAARSGCISLSL